MGFIFCFSRYFVHNLPFSKTNCVISTETSGEQTKKEILYGHSNFPNHLEEKIHLKEKEILTGKSCGAFSPIL